MFLDNIIPILGTYLHSGMVELWFTPLISLAIIATVPCIIHRLLR